MRKLILYIAPLLLAFGALAHADDNETIWKQAADYYDQGKYNQAIDSYQKLLERGMNNAEIYYNLGNSYFKADQMGRAIWAFRRALLIDPHLKAARDNLEYVRSHNADQIQIKGRGFVQDIWDFLTGIFSVNGYLLIFMVSWWLVCSIAIYKITRFNTPEWPYFLLIFALVVTIFSAASAARRISEDRLAHWGVLAQESVDIREGPGAEFKKIEVGHEGLEFKILGARENSYLIELGNGLKGWVDRQAVLEI